MPEPVLCPKCGEPVPANEATAYRGRHEDCTGPDTIGTISAAPTAVKRGQAACDLYGGRRHSNLKE